MQQNPTYSIPPTPENTVATPSKDPIIAGTVPSKNKSLYVAVIVVLVVLVLGLTTLALYLVFANRTRSIDIEENSLPTPTSETTNIEPSEAEKSEYSDFSYPVFISMVRDQDDPYLVSGKALKEAELVPSADEDEASFTIKGEGYELGVSAFYESEASSYSDFVLIDTVGEEKIARIKYDYNQLEENEHRYVRSTTVSDTEDCEGMGPDLLTAPCGSSHYTSGNEVETFYILDVWCIAEEQNLSKCDDIVKSLDVRY